MLIAFTVRPAGAFWIYLHGHGQITNAALSGISVTLDGGTFKFTDKAKEQIIDANRGTDQSAGGEKSLAKAHFDDEKIPEGSQRLLELKDQAKAAARDRDGATARNRLGRALHTLQDYYAHSNWLELMRQGVVSGIDTRLGRGQITTGGSFPPAVSPGDPTGAPLLLGLRDPRFFDPALRKVATGYYELFGCYAPLGKVRHGDLSHELCEGVAKDPPLHPGHFAAASLATAATEDFVRLVIQELQPDTRAIKTLLGIEGASLGFVIDTTGSMGDEIGQVKSEVHSIVDALRGEDDEPSEYLLQTFSDPDVGSPFTTSDPDAFLSAVDSLSVGGGGDCPELAMTGLLRAIPAVNEDSNLFLFTDADAKDGGLAGNVIAAAVAKDVQINFGLTGTCSSDFAGGPSKHGQRPDAHPIRHSAIDASYSRVATATGGFLLTVTKPELHRIFELVRPTLGGNVATIQSARGVFTGSTPVDIPVPVDVTMSTLIVSVSGANLTTLELRRPSGVPVAEGDPGVTITPVTDGTIITVVTPEAGAWRLRIGGTGDYIAQMRGNSNLQFFRFDFVREVTTEEAHDGGLIPLAGQPTKGTPAIGSARLLGTGAGARFALVGPGGERLQAVDLKQEHPLADPDDYVGQFDLPAGPFRILATGIDARGNPFQRLFPTEFLARAARVQVGGEPRGIIPAGQTTRFLFNVTNLGPNTTFDFLASLNLGSAQVTPTSQTLGTGEVGKVAVDVTVPAGAEAGTILNLAFTATSRTDAEATNSATQILEVVTAAAPRTPGPLFTGEKSADAVTLAWVDNSTGGGDEEEGFEVERGTTPTNGTVIGTVGANVTTFTDTEVEPGETFYYRVRSVNVIGLSTFSNQETVKVPRRLESVSSKVRVRKGPLRPYLKFQRRNGTYFGGLRQSVEIRNVTRAPIEGPVYLILDSLPETSHLVNPGGLTSTITPLGSAYLKLNVGRDGVLSPGERVTMTVKFLMVPPRTLMGLKRFRYEARIFAGEGTP